MGLLDYINQAGAGLFGTAQVAKRGLLDAYETLTQPNRFDPIAAQYLMNTPQRASQNFHNAFPDPRLIGKQTPEGRAAREQLGNTMLGFAAPIVYHGSPHTFAKFDSSKIGTGEGNQAYGHGLYFAESQDVAKGYADNLAMRSNGMSVAEIKAQLANIKATMQGPLRSQAMQENARQMEMAKRAQGSIPSVYKVDLPDSADAKMLDWDKPLSQQPLEAQTVLREMWRKAKKSFPSLDPKGDPIVGQVHHIYSQHRGGNSAAVADEMRQAGIPGIKYLDGGSRGSGQGSRNYVVFPGNEGLLSILERNGLQP